jgi:hypothetical protein
MFQRQGNVRERSSTGLEAGQHGIMFYGVKEAARYGKNEASYKGMGPASEKPKIGESTNSLRPSPGLTGGFRDQKKTYSMRYSRHSSCLPSKSFIQHGT